jgi:chemotaxis protein CheD
MKHHADIAGKLRNTLITQGQFAASADPAAVIQTLLGSCVSVCLWDETAGAGGMNHLLLAGERIGNRSGYDMAGVAEMECLINGIIKIGGRRERLKAKVFGGAKMLDYGPAIGDTNARFAFDFLEQEGIACVNSSVGGQAARALRFWPASGRVIMRFVKDAPEDVAAEKVVAPRGNDLELF